MITPGFFSVNLPMLYCWFACDVICSRGKSNGSHIKSQFHMFHTFFFFFYWQCYKKLKTFEHNHSMSNFGLFFFFFVQMSWIFACGLRFNRKSQPCIFFRWFALHFRVKTYAKNSRLQDASLVSLFGKTIGFFCLARSITGCKKRRRVFCIRFNWKTKRKPAEKKYRAVTFY